MYYHTGRGPIIAKLHATRERWGIFEQIFEEDICDKLRARQQNYMFVSLHIPKKSNKTRSEPINIYIYKNHGGSHGHKI